MKELIIKTKADLESALGDDRDLFFDGHLIFEIDVKHEYRIKDISASGDISARDISASGDISARYISARYISARYTRASGDISARDIRASGGIIARDISARDIRASEYISARDISASGDIRASGDISARDIRARYIYFLSVYPPAFSSAKFNRLLPLSGANDREYWAERFGINTEEGCYEEFSKQIVSALPRLKKEGENGKWNKLEQMIIDSHEGKYK